MKKLISLMLCLCLMLCAAVAEPAENAGEAALPEETEKEAD